MSELGKCILSKGNTIIMATEYGKSANYLVVDFNELPDGRVAMIVKRLEDLP